MMGLRRRPETFSEIGEFKLTRAYFDSDEIQLNQIIDVIDQ